MISKKNEVILCPFHTEKTPSCAVKPDNTFHCIGCGATGYVRDDGCLILDEPKDEEEVIHSCYTGLAVSDEFFCKKQSMDDEDLLPAIHELATQCSGMIREPGMYALKLRLVKLK